MSDDKPLGDGLKTPMLASPQLGQVSTKGSQSLTTEKQLTAFIALIYNLNKQMLSLTAFAQTLVTENRALKVKIGVLESEKPHLDKSKS